MQEKTSTPETPKESVQSHKPTDRVTWALAFPGVHPVGRLVLASLAVHADQSKLTCWPSLETLARETQVSERGVRGSLRSLEAAGAIRTEQSRGRTSNVYRLMIPPNPAISAGLNPVEPPNPAISAPLNHPQPGNLCPPTRQSLPGSTRQSLPPNRVIREQGKEQGEEDSDARAHGTALLVFNHWNSQDALTHHRALTKETAVSINARIAAGYSEADLCQAITRYAVLCQAGTAPGHNQWSLLLLMKREEGGWLDRMLDPNYEGIISETRDSRRRKQNAAALTSHALLETHALPETSAYQGCSTCAGSGFIQLKDGVKRCECRAKPEQEPDLVCVGEAGEWPVSDVWT